MSPDTERAIVDLLGKRFIARGDKHAEQDDKGYHPVNHALKRSELTAHIRGEKSLGHYLISPEDDCVKLVAFDLDARKPLSDVDRQRGMKDAVVEGKIVPDPRGAFGDPSDPDHNEVKWQLNLMAFMLASQMRDIVCRPLGIDVTCAVACSGNKGVHVYGWFPERTPAVKARILANAVLESLADDNMIFEPTLGDNFFWNEADFPCVEVEMFPKQDALASNGKTHGNLMRLPLGVHLKSGKPSYFMQPGKGEFVAMDPLIALERGSLG